MLSGLLYEPVGWKSARTCTAELQTMLGVMAVVLPSALRFSCQRRLKARPPSRIA